MCTRFVFNGKETITGFNFDIDLADWDYRVLTDSNRFFIGIKQADGVYHSFHGINKNGNVGTLLYVHGNEAGMSPDTQGGCTISSLTEQYIKNEISFDTAVNIAKTRKIIYAPDATMQAMFSNKNGDVLILEPGIGSRKEHKRYSLITNYSILKPETTREFINPGDDRYQRAKKMLDSFNDDFSINDAFSILEAVLEKGKWATRVSFVYSTKQQKVFYALNGDFSKIFEHAFIN